MKLVIISDSHGNIVRLRHVLGFALEARVGAIIHCGDWYTIAPIDFARVKSIPVYGVLGNNDYRPELLEELKNAGIKYAKDFLDLTLDGLKIGVCHYPPSLKLRRDKPSRFSDTSLSSQKYDIIFCGHMHRKADYMVGSTRIINPGALHMTPEPSFAVYDTKTDKLEFVDVAV